MLLVADVGNTQTVLGLYDGESLTEHWRVATEADRTADELAVLLARLLELRDRGFEDVVGVCISSTVPALVRSYAELCERYVERPSSSSARASRRAFRSSTTTHARWAPTGS